MSDAPITARQAQLCWFLIRHLRTSGKDPSKYELAAAGFDSVYDADVEVALRFFGWRRPLTLGYPPPMTQEAFDLARAKIRAAVYSAKLVVRDRTPLPLPDPRPGRDGLAVAGDRYSGPQEAVYLCRACQCKTSVKLPDNVPSPIQEPPTMTTPKPVAAPPAPYENFAPEVGQTRRIKRGGMFTIIDDRIAKLPGGDRYELLCRFADKDDEEWETPGEVARWSTYVSGPERRDEKAVLSSRIERVMDKHPLIIDRVIAAGTLREYLAGRSAADRETLSSTEHLGAILTAMTWYASALWKVSGYSVAQSIADRTGADTSSDPYAHGADPTTINMGPEKATTLCGFKINGLRAPWLRTMTGVTCPVCIAKHAPKTATFEDAMAAQRRILDALYPGTVATVVDGGLKAWRDGGIEALNAFIEATTASRRKEKSNTVRHTFKIDLVYRDLMARWNESFQKAMADATAKRAAGGPWSVITYDKADPFDAEQAKAILDAVTIDPRTTIKIDGDKLKAAFGLRSRVDPAKFIDDAIDAALAERHKLENAVREAIGRVKLAVYAGGNSAPLTEDLATLQSFLANPDNDTGYWKAARKEVSELLNAVEISKRSDVAVQANPDSITIKGRSFTGPAYEMFAAIEKAAKNAQAKRRSHEETIRAGALAAEAAADLSNALAYLAQNGWVRVDQSTLRKTVGLDEKQAATLNRDVLAHDYITKNGPTGAHTAGQLAHAAYQYADELIRLSAKAPDDVRAILSANAAIGSAEDAAALRVMIDRELRNLAKDVDLEKHAWLSESEERRDLVRQVGDLFLKRGWRGEPLMPDPVKHHMTWKYEFSASPIQYRVLAIGAMHVEDGRGSTIDDALRDMIAKIITDQGHPPAEQGATDLTAGRAALDDFAVAVTGDEQPVFKGIDFTPEHRVIAIQIRAMLIDLGWNADEIRWELRFKPNDSWRFAVWIPFERAGSSRSFTLIFESKAIQCLDAKRGVAGMLVEMLRHVANQVAAELYATDHPDEPDAAQRAPLPYPPTQ